VIEKCKVQIGNMLLDGIIDVEYTLSQEPPPPNLSAQLKAYAAKYPTWGKVVEGSVVHPIVDPARLLEGGKDD
jgi:hypothetical protein